MQAEILASEAPWGVGYTTALVTLRTSKEASPVVSTVPTPRRVPSLVRLAREAVEAHIRHGNRTRPTAATDPAWEASAPGSLSRFEDDQGELRGCIGTVQPVEVNVLEEIVTNGIAAATRDPRFLPVQTDELSQLHYKVDVLMEPEPIAETSELDHAASASSWKPDASADCCCPISKASTPRKNKCAPLGKRRESSG